MNESDRDQFLQQVMQTTRLSRSFREWQRTMREQMRRDALGGEVIPPSSR